MPREESTLRDRVRGVEDPERVATVLVEWMTEQDLDSGLIDWERSRRHPTIDGRIAEQLPKSLVHMLTRDSRGWAIGATPPAAEHRSEVGEDGAVRSWAPATDSWEVDHASVGSMLLGYVLRWIGTYAPAARAFEFEPSTGPVPPDDAEALHETINRRIHEVVPEWYVADDALLRVTPGRDSMMGTPENEVLGRRRAEVERVLLPHAVWSAWRSVEHAMEAETDNWSAPLNDFPGVVGSIAGHDLVAEVAGTTPVVAYDSFLEAWFGTRLTEEVAAIQGFPRALVSALAAGPDLYLDAHLTDPIAGRFSGPPNRFLAECQYMWQAGFEERGVDDPRVVLRVEEDPPQEVITEFTVAQLLLRVLIDEATFCSPVTGTAMGVDPDLLAAAIGDLQPFGELPGFAAPAFTDGKIIVICDGFRWGRDSVASIRFAAHSREDVVASPIGRLPRLDWSYPDDQRTRSPGQTRWAEQLQEVSRTFLENDFRFPQ